MSKRRLRVAENTQINYEGQVYGPGETFEIEADRAIEYVAAGLAQVVEKRGRKG